MWLPSFAKFLYDMPAKGITVIVFGYIRLHTSNPYRHNLRDIIQSPHFSYIPGVAVFRVFDHFFNRAVFGVRLCHKAAGRIPQVFA
jgi:hypothetical protein